MKAKQRRSGKCHNCEEQLTEEQNFCPNCGQSNTDNNVTFWVLIKEFVDNYLGIDSKMAHSFLPFLLRPGKLTNRFQAGQIKHFIHPIRLYFVLSLLYFFVISYLLSGINFSSIDDDNNNTFGGTTNIENLIDGERLSQLSDSIKINLIPDSLRTNYNSIKSFKVLYDTLQSNLDDDFFEGLKVDVEGLQVPTKNDERFMERAHRLARDKKVTDAAFMDSITFKLDDAEFSLFTGKSKTHFNQQVRKVFENDEGFKGFVLGNLPFMMFILIPLFAGVLKLIYVRRKHLYIKHIVHALHVHAFAYFVYAVGLLIIFKLFTPEIFPNMNHEMWRGIVAFIMFVGVSTYVYISFLRTYEQGWFKTLVKFNIVGFIYVIFLQIFFYAEVFISFWYY
jgi:uncharacterized protein DUF3667